MTQSHYHYQFVRTQPSSIHQELINDLITPELFEKVSNGLRNAESALIQNRIIAENRANTEGDAFSVKTFHEAKKALEDFGGVMQELSTILILALNSAGYHLTSAKVDMEANNGISA